MLTYRDVPATMYSTLRASMASRGLMVSGNEGVIKKLGAIVMYNYEPSSQILTVDVTHAPWTMRLATFTTKVDSAIKAVLTRAQ